jgi:tRNA modification GTPase
LRILGEFPGLRPAEPGEFTKRALLNRKLDLTEAEAVKELIESRTEVQRQRALEGLSGETSQRYSSWRQILLKCIADVEAQIDFGEDEHIDMASLNKSFKEIEHLKSVIEKYRHESKRKGNIARNGFQVVIMGEPNVGKSSLINRLAARDVSIVSKIEGTTRDIIEVVLDLGGHLVTLCDTAGLRELSSSGDHESIEEEGMKRARSRAHSADLIIFLLDASRPSSTQLNSLLKENPTLQVLKVVNKTDLMNQNKEKTEILEGDCFISCKNNEGIQKVEEEIIDRIKSVYSAVEHGFMTERQESHLNQVSASLTNALNVIGGQEEDVDFVTLAHYLRRAATSLASLTHQKISSDDVLDIIFRDFCIGK